MVVDELRNTILADLVQEAKRLQKNPRSALVDFPYLEEKVETAAVEKEQS